jgi:hypothetical protein
MSEPYKPWHTIRVGPCRAVYHPEWDSVRPWVLYVRGGAMMHAATADEAERILRHEYHCTGPRTDTPGTDA